MPDEWETLLERVAREAFIEGHIAEQQAFAKAEGKILERDRIGKEAGVTAVKAVLRAGLEAQAEIEKQLRGLERSLRTAASECVSLAAYGKLCGECEVRIETADSLLAILGKEG